MPLGFFISLAALFVNGVNRYAVAGVVSGLLVGLLFFGLPFLVMCLS